MTVTARKKVRLDLVAKKITEVLPMRLPVKRLKKSRAQTRDKTVKWP